MSTLILPCAGASSRYPNMRPKWALNHPDGSMMVTKGISGMNLSNVEKIVLTAYKGDVEKWNLNKAIKTSLQEIQIPFEVVLLDRRTRSQSETVVRSIEKANIDGHIIIKDCDDYLSCDIVEPNSVLVHSLHDMDEVIAKNKSYVITDTMGNITDIVEKSVINDLFCVGGYSFADAERFLITYDKIVDKVSSELYISHIIYQQLLDGVTFKAHKVERYSDWGTLEDWNKYKSEYKTIFTDLDGVLVENSAEYFEPIWGTTEAIQENVDYMNDLYDSGKCRIIITTSRKSSFKEVTISQLDREGIKYHDIIFDLPHAERIVINDFSKSNKYPTCSSVNIPRNSSNLEDFMK